MYQPIPISRDMFPFVWQWYDFVFVAICLIPVIWSVWFTIKMYIETRPTAQTDSLTKSPALPLWTITHHPCPPFCGLDKITEDDDDVAAIEAILRN